MSITIPSFAPETLEQAAQSFADVLPSGGAFLAKNIQNSNLRKLLKGMSQELIRYDQMVFDLIQNFIPGKNPKFLDEWEQVVGIPDDCFSSGEFNDTDRMRNIIIKLAYLKLNNLESYVNLAAILGLTIEVKTFLGDGGVLTLFPYTFPFPLGQSFLDLNEITIVITSSAAPGFPYVFPFKLGDENTELFECLVLKQKPITVKINFEYDII